MQLHCPTESMYFERNVFMNCMGAIDVSLGVSGEPLDSVSVVFTNNLIDVSVSIDYHRSQFRLAFDEQTFSRKFGGQHLYPVRITSSNEHGCC